LSKKSAFNCSLITGWTLKCPLSTTLHYMRKWCFTCNYFLKMNSTAFSLTYQLCNKPLPSQRTVKLQLYDPQLYDYLSFTTVLSSPGENTIPKMYFYLQLYDAQLYDNFSGATIFSRPEPENPFSCTNNEKWRI